MINHPILKGGRISIPEWLSKNIFTYDKKIKNKRYIVICYNKKCVFHKKNKCNYTSIVCIDEDGLCLSAEKIKIENTVTGDFDGYR